jgi:hypothetical protein
MSGYNPPTGEKPEVWYRDPGTDLIYTGIPQPPDHRPTPRERTGCGAMSCIFTMVFGVVAMITLNTSAPRPVGIIFLLLDKDIYLIDSKLYEQGRYTWDDGPGTLMYERPRLAPSASSGRLEQTGYSPGQSKPSFKLGFALQEMRRHSSGLVHGIVVVHGDVEIRTRYEEPVPHADEIPAPTDDGKRDPVYVCTPEGLVRYIEARIDEAARSLEPIEDPRESTSPPRYLMMTNLDPETGRYEEVSLPGTYKVPVRTAQSLRARMKPD